MMNMVDNKLKYSEDTKARFNSILCRLDCGYKTTRETVCNNSLIVRYTMPNGEAYLYTEDLHGNPVSIERVC